VVRVPVRKVGGGEHLGLGTLGVLLFPGEPVRKREVGDAMQCRSGHAQEAPAFQLPFHRFRLEGLVGPLGDLLVDGFQQGRVDRTLDRRAVLFLEQETGMRGVGRRVDRRPDGRRVRRARRFLRRRLRRAAGNGSEEENEKQQIRMRLSFSVCHQCIRKHGAIK